MRRGNFIVLEGCEGAGKTSVAEFLREKLETRDVLFTREPGGTPLAEKIRAVMISPEATETSAETQFALAFAARFDHAKRVILPALAKGGNVVSERFDSSTYAYQIVGQNAPQLKKLFFEFRGLLGDCVPDLYIFLDVDPAEGLKRMWCNTKKKEPIDQFERRDLAFHSRVREGLIEFFKTVPSVTIDASRPFEAVKKEALGIIRAHISR